MLFKLDRSGNGEEVVLEDLKVNTGLTFVGWTHAMFQEVRIVACTSGLCTHNRGLRTPQDTLARPLYARKARQCVWSCPPVLWDLGMSSRRIGFSDVRAVQMCVMSGCDFLQNIPGIGIKKSHALIKKWRSFTKASLAARYTLCPQCPHTSAHTNKQHIYVAHTKCAMSVTLAHACLHVPEHVCVSGRANAMLCVPLCL